MTLHERLRIDLQGIDAALREVVETDHELPRPSDIYDGIQRLIAAGGKRLRPMLVMVGSRFGEPGREEQVRRTAALLEYMHMASLVHDDVIDNSELRRGKPTLHTLTDVSTAVHTANYMMARAVEWASSYEADGVDGSVDKSADNNVDHSVDESVDDHADEDMLRSAQIASIVTDLCIGEYGQLRNRFNFDMTMDQYLDKTRRKTALLMAECLQAGGAASGADKRTKSLLFEFGEAIGMSFQIKDDMLDFTATEAAIGKPAGADLRNGNVTLPVLYALENEQLAPIIRALSAESSDAEMDDAIRLIRDSGAIERAAETAQAYGEHAYSLIAKLEPHPACADLRLLADHFLRA